MITVVERAGKRMAELDAGGTALVILRGDSEQDIRAVVETYVHQKTKAIASVFSPLVVESSAVVNMYEIIPNGNLREYYPREEREQGEPFVNKLNDFLSVHYAERIYRMIYIPDIRRFENDFSVMEMLKKIARLKREGKSRILIVIGSTDGYIAEGLERISYMIDLDYPGMEEIKDIVKEMYLECAEYPNLSILDYVLNDIASRFRGFHREKIRSTMMLAYARFEDPLTNQAEGLKAEITESKIQLLKNTEGLRLLEETDADVGGLEALRKWADKRILLYHNYAAARVHKVSMPKGVLVTGIPGTGKTLTARWFAGQMKLPALQLDMGAIVGRYLGESEARFRRAIRMVEAAAPCILFIDELEKAFDGVGGASGSDSNSSLRRIFAYFLGWLQDADKREAPVFVFATANKASLPPEFLRKGRFDEKFYSFMPVYEECKKILQVHIRKHDDVILWNWPENGKGWSELTKEEMQKEKERQIDQLIVKDFLCCAARQEKFMTGADLEAVVTEAFQYLFVEEFQKKETDKKAASLGICENIKSTPEEIGRMLCEVLEETRVYSETNMENIVSCWLDMQKNKMKSVSGDKPILDFQKYDPETGMFREMNAGSTPKDYGNWLIRRKEELLRSQDSEESQMNTYGMNLYDAMMQICLKQEIWGTVDKSKRG